jgi:hypothetical protein
MGAGQIAEAHQELAHDLPAGEAECLLDQLDPIVLVDGMMVIEPGRKGAVFRADLLQALGILDGGVDLQAVADDPASASGRRFSRSP